MDKVKLGKLQEVDIRKVWTHEQYDFQSGCLRRKTYRNLAIH